MRKTFITAFLFFAAIGSAQDVREMYLRSIKAYKYKDYPTYLKITKVIDSMRPGNQVYTYNLVRAYALNNMPDKAFEVLKKSILSDSQKEFETDEDLASLKSDARFAEMTALKARQNLVAETSQKVVTLNERMLHPEGLAYLAKKKKWLASSIRKGKIVEFDVKTGKCTDWLDTDYAVFAIKADKDEKYLWAATSAVEEMENYKHELSGKGEILKINIKTKTVEERFSVGGKHTYGDLLVADNGIVYVSDSYNPVIYKIQDGSMVPFYRVTDKLISPQGITFNGDQSKIYAANHLGGILEIPVADPDKKRWLAFPAEVSDKGIDGLLWHDNSLIAIHNGVKPIRIIRYFLDAAGNISNFAIIDNNRPAFSEPTVGIAVKNRFYFFANCPWPAFNAKHQLDESKVENPMLYSFSLEK